MNKSLKDRSAGILCHFTSLPGSFASGDLGPAAFDFAQFTAEAGAAFWQVLPCHPTGAGDSPYQSLSAFAGNPLLLSLEKMMEKGWLSRTDLMAPWALPEERADFGASFEFRLARLRRAWEGFEHTATPADRLDLDEFCRREAFWLEDWALFAAIKRAQGGRHWVEWPEGLRDAQRPALAAAARELEAELRFERFVQYAFDLQWNELKKFAASRGVGLVGDLPIFVSHDSADVWAHRELFDLDEKGQPLKVAGVPPDYFSEEGQRWGNPLYRWELHRNTGYRWWVARFHRAFQLFDAVRVDHFIGFQRYWEIPAESQTARNGQYKPGPGASFFEQLGRQFDGKLPIIAEDLGLVTPEVTALRKQFGLPGMRVIQFCFGGKEEDLPDRIEEDVAAYSGTHDNDTSRGWLEEQPLPGMGEEQARAFRAEKLRARKWCEGKEEGAAWPLVAAALESKAVLAVAPMQDLLDLPSSARMNSPGTMQGNWRWRMKAGAASKALAARFRKLVERTGRGALRAPTE